MYSCRLARPKGDPERPTVFDAKVSLFDDTVCQIAAAVEKADPRIRRRMESFIFGLVIPGKVKCYFS